MQHTHILESNFHIVSKQRSGSGRYLALHADRPRSAFFLAGAELLMDALFALLDRLKLCRSPRILSAECLADETVLNPAASTRH